ncbi:MAG: vWA domain-containing protein [Spirochaetaceae bacterium]
MKRASTATLLLLLASTLVTAQSLTISQIDASHLLTRQQVDLYVSLTDEDGDPIEGADRGDFRVSESTDGEEFEPVPVTAFDAGAAAEEGITFFLLVDNSGSMYDTLESRPTEESANRRITHARSAIRTFLSGIDNPRDEVGLASFNTLYAMHAEPTRDTSRIDSLLDDIERPDRREAFTELYASIREAVDDVAVAQGRTVLVVLSDGENYPYFEYTGEEHPEYGDRLFTYGEAVERAQREGISVYAVNFGPERDSNLEEIATESGGRVYDARNRDELAAVYQDIRRRVLEEYRITYRATVAPAERKHVRVEYRRPGAGAETARFYFADTMFGTPSERFGPLLIIPLIAALLGWLVIRRLRFANRRRDANLEVLGDRTQIFPLVHGQTVVGTSESADVTVAATRGARGGGAAGGGAGAGAAATVVYDESSNTYTVHSDEEIRVNNRPVKRKKLEAGDVLTIGESTVVFDDTRE